MSVRDEAQGARNAGTEAYQNDSLVLSTAQRRSAPAQAIKQHFLNSSLMVPRYGIQIKER